jgi:hypothetical protein
MIDAKSEMDRPLLQLHLEPGEPIEVDELTAALSALSHQYQSFAVREGWGGRASDARLLVASVAPGSIDINFLPELAIAGGLLAPLLPYADLIAKFAESLSSLFEFFKGDDKGGPIAERVTIKDCDDAINLAAPIAQHGGSQTFNIIKGDVYTGPVLMMNSGEAREVLEGAQRTKARLLFPASKPHQRVSMVWKRLDSDETATKGVRSPDKGLIEEIDPDKPHAVLFTDEMMYLKTEMMRDAENPYRKVYFVDVEVSRVGERITAYRIVGYHGSDDLD